MTQRRWQVGFAAAAWTILVSAGCGFATVQAMLYRADPSGQTGLREFVELRLAIGRWPVNRVAPGAFPSARLAAPAIVRIDLDDDGRMEALVTLASAQACDGFGCPIEIWRWRPEGLTRILETRDLPLVVGEHWVDGWKVLHGRRYDYYWMRQQPYIDAPCEPTDLGEYIAWCRAGDTCINFYKYDAECVRFTS